MDCPVKITWKWGITLVPGFICWKIIFDLEISDGHFVFALKKIRSRVPKWQKADSCSGYPLEPESMVKHRPYRETRLSYKMPFGNWTKMRLSQQQFQLQIHENHNKSTVVQKGSAQNNINPYPAKLFYLNFYPLEVASPYRDPQLRVGGNFAYLFNLKTKICKT